jgi:hypothetical protein
MTKHLEARTLSWAVPASLMYDALRLAAALRVQHVNVARAILHGSVKFREILPGVLQERHRVQAQRIRSDSDLFRLGVLTDLGRSAREWRRLGGLGKTQPV